VVEVFQQNGQTVTKTTKVVYMNKV
jgi:hypothetical protein